MPVASAVAQQEISQQQSLTLMRNMMRLYLSNVCHGRGLFPESDFEPSRHAPSVRSPLAPLSRGIQKKRASQASEPIHTVFQEKKSQQKRPTRAAGRR